MQTLTQKSYRHTVTRMAGFKQTYIWVVLALIVLGVMGYFVYAEQQKPGELDEFAQCLTDKGATFYGAFWCPHCQSQKAMFGKSEKLLDYIECSTPDGESQTEECTEAGIESYPTWEFEDGTRETGEVPLETLSEKTSCPLP